MKIPGWMDEASTVVQTSTIHVYMALYSIDAMTRLLENSRNLVFEITA
jgi:hypothetical protein